MPKRIKESYVVFSSSVGLVCAYFSDFIFIWKCWILVNFTWTIRIPCFKAIDLTAIVEISVCRCWCVSGNLILGCCRKLLRPRQMLTHPIYHHFKTVCPSIWAFSWMGRLLRSHPSYLRAGPTWMVVAMPDLLVLHHWYVAFRFYFSA